MAGALGHAMVPMAVLLSVRARRSARALTGVAALLAAMAVLRAWWTVLPEVSGTHAVLTLLTALACLAGVGGVAAAVALRRVGAVHA